MNHGKYVFAQLFETLPKYEFDKCVARYQGNSRVKGFTCWIQFLTMSFGQLTNRESLRDTVNCLSAHQKKFYHLGINFAVSRSTVAEANEQRNWRIYADFAKVLLTKARRLYLHDEFGLDIPNTVYALDATTIDLCLSVFWWASFRKAKAAVKLHTLLDLRGLLPTFISITDGKTHDVNILDELVFEPLAIYLMDKGYLDFARLFRINQASAFFVTRAKTNLAFARIYSKKVDKKLGLRCDQTIKLTTHKSSKAYPEKLRRVTYYDKEQGKMYVFLTNNFEITAMEVALLYKHRWKIELFFKWIKQHLKIKTFWGETENAVKTQIWIAVCTYLMMAIVKKELKIERNLYAHSTNNFSFNL
ncbi:IS4 family transposase [soil metagenome]